ncbi:MAG TPA: tRNA (adenosine(37)-N6)-threonylcarbamoyltransferase complex ATPase subunit type 1 TsaE, partial [Candidatus Absconditabacterales bacterium]|nr:tRNA (adenosine(37)-N6)-threonylcarbamoyltransferase complex ATPase subunit type 1 TsaE [Candidatus Absconditabacterales bacterium]
MTKIATPQEMIEYGKMLAKTHKILLVHGELGAGKTLLTKGFAQGLGLKDHHVQSPTYAYLNIYDSKLLHIDMYRIKEYNELVEKGIIDQINEFDYIVIERPKFMDQLPFKDSTTVHIKKISETERS